MKKAIVITTPTSKYNPKRGQLVRVVCDLRDTPNFCSTADGTHYEYEEGCAYNLIVEFTQSDNNQVSWAYRPQDLLDVIEHVHAKKEVTLQLPDPTSWWVIDNLRAILSMYVDTQITMPQEDIEMPANYEYSEYSGDAGAPVPNEISLHDNFKAAYLHTHDEDLVWHFLRMAYNLGRQAMAEDKVQLYKVAVEGLRHRVDILKRRLDKKNK